MTPEFFIIGERKCGTSSLYRYLVDHPEVLPGRRKEMQFFTRGEAHVEAHFQDYLAQFPAAEDGAEAVLDWPELDENGVLFEESVRVERKGGGRCITGEASADTFCEVDPKLLQRFLPGLKLVLVIRDPVERALSHHRMLHRFQAEGRPLPYRVGDFERDMQREMADARAGVRGLCVSPGIYMDRLPLWVEVWGRDRLIVVESSQLADVQRRRSVMTDVQRFLGLSADDHGAALERNFNTAPPAAVPSSARSALSAFYRPHNEQLERYLERALGWS